MKFNLNEELKALRRYLPSFWNYRENREGDEGAKSASLFPAGRRLIMGFLPLAKVVDVSSSSLRM